MFDKFPYHQKYLLFDQRLTNNFWKKMKQEDVPKLEISSPLPEDEIGAKSEVSSKKLET